MGKKAAWATRLGFYLTAVGSASGLGNLWRFPYVVAENGGGAFVLIYVLLAFVVGLSLLIAELMLGKITGNGIVLSLSSLKYQNKKPFGWIGKLALVLTLFVLSYYAVISGWVLHFAIQFFMSLIGFNSLEGSSVMGQLLENGWLQAGLTSVHLILAMIIVVRGVQEGLEKWIGWIMPIFALLLFVLVFKSLSMRPNNDALRFLFYPDFSKLTLSSLIQAVGHVFFTLSLGFGINVTFGSYLKDTENVPTAAYRIAFIDTFISLIAGLVVFPIAMQASNIPLRDPRLLFESLPDFLIKLPQGKLFGFGFFVSLYLASLGASIGLFEVVVSNWVNHKKVKRVKASGIVMLGVLILSLVLAFSGSVLKNLKFFGRGLLEATDSLVINWALPLIAFGIALAITFGVSESQKESVFIDENKVESASLFRSWLFVLKYVVPVIIVIAFVLKISSFFN